jgi:acetyl-CoA carboxylase biotin carboxyl carrier protein
MDMKEIKKIIELMKENDLCEFELAEEGFRITIRRRNGLESQVLVSQNAAGQMVVAQPSPATVPAAAPAAEPEKPSNLVEIKSPMVGTFYRSPSPEAEPFVSMGKDVEEETVVCIVEAMKVMNEIKAEVRGVVRKVLVENATSVEFGQPLFLVEPR